MIAEVRYHVVDGIRLYDQAEGAGAPLLLLHGLLFSHRSWRRVAPRLAESFAVHAIDLPGHGESDRPAAYSYSFDALVHTLAGLLDELGLGKVWLMGHSLGGGLGVLLAARYPERVQGLVLVSPFVYPVPLSLEMRLALVPVVGELVFKHLYGRRDLERFLRHNVYLDPSLPTEEDLQYAWERLNRPGGRDATYRLMQHLARPEVLAAAPPRVSCPVRVIRGQRDRLMPLANAERLVAELGQAELVSIPGTRHMPMEERPDAFLEAVLPFLGER